MKKATNTLNFETGTKLSYVNNDYTIVLQDRRTRQLHFEHQ
jgi:hypothetical protein